ncbi:hypothetical protein H0O01_03810 [Candidatus Micrarchaeota archaeon]|nr:hypothetical protein [Candidatus Micrarchaeota archaeon]
MFTDSGTNWALYDHHHPDGLSFIVAQYQKAGAGEREALATRMVKSIVEYIQWGEMHRPECGMPVSTLGDHLRDFAEGKVQLPAEAVAKILEAHQKLREARNIHLSHISWSVLSGAVFTLDLKKGSLRLDRRLRTALEACLNPPEAVGHMHRRKQDCEHTPAAGKRAPVAKL